MFIVNEMGINRQNNSQYALISITPWPVSEKIRQELFSEGSELVEVLPAKRSAVQAETHDELYKKLDIMFYDYWRWQMHALLGWMAAHQMDSASRVTASLREYTCQLIWPNSSPLHQALTDWKKIRTDIIRTIREHGSEQDAENYALLNHSAEIFLKELSFPGTKRRWLDLRLSAKKRYTVTQ